MTNAKKIISRILTTEQKNKEGSMSLIEAESAIYIDFEGFENKPPTLIGIEEDGFFFQVNFDPELIVAAEEKGIQTQDGKSFMKNLLEKAIKEKRRIVAFSQHEKNKCLDFYGIDLSISYADARLIAKKNRLKFIPNDIKKPKSLDDYLRLYGREHASYFGVRLATKKIKFVKDMLSKKKIYSELTASAKRHWTNLLEYNKIDVQGMRFLINKCAL